MNFNDDEEEDETFSEISCGLDCAAPRLLVGVERVDHELGKTLYVLKISLVDTPLEWTVKRRYSEFFEMREDVCVTFMRRNVNQCFGCRWFSNSLRDFEFPRKRIVSSKEKAVIRFRKVQLERFARLVAAHTFSSIPKCVRCKEEPFNRIRDFFTVDAHLPDHTTAKQIKRALVPERFGPIADPSKSKIEFRRGHGIFRVIQVEKPILVRYAELDEVTRDERLKRRCSSLSSDASPRDVDSMSEGIDLDEEKPATLLSNENKDDADTSVSPSEIIATENAVSLQPLAAMHKQDKNDPTLTQINSSSSGLEPWKSTSLKRTAAREA